jgi:hypothetical protein
MNVYQIDPITDFRWAELVARQHGASVFHTVGWLKALQRTYGYAPVAFTTSPPTSELKNGIVCCRIDSWLTGRRLVSLPFSDHCEPLYDSAEDADFLIRSIQNALTEQKWKYLELRPIQMNFAQTGDNSDFLAAGKYFLHRLDLRPDLNSVFGSLDKDSVQRRIQRAENAAGPTRCSMISILYSLLHEDGTTCLPSRTHGLTISFSARARPLRSGLPIRTERQSLRSSRCDSGVLFTINMDVQTRDLTGLEQRHGSCGERSRPENRMEQTSLIWDVPKRITRAFLPSKTTGCANRSAWCTGNFRNLLLRVQLIAGNYRWQNVYSRTCPTGC